MKRTKNQETAREYTKIESFKLLNVNETQYNVFFSAVINGVTIYNMRVVTGKDGTDFIAFPSSKDKNGKYWNHCYIAISPEDQESIIKDIENYMNQ